MRSYLRLVLVIVALSATAACAPAPPPAAGASPSGSPTGSPAAPPSATVEPSAGPTSFGPKPTASPDETVIGVVETPEAPGCLVLDAGERGRFALTGAVHGARPGRRVAVRGRILAGAKGHCGPRRIMAVTSIAAAP